VSSSLGLGGCAAEPREDRSAPAFVARAEPDSELDSAELFMSWFSSVDIRSSHGRFFGGGVLRPGVDPDGARRAVQRWVTRAVEGEIPAPTEFVDLEEPTELTTWALVLASLAEIETDFRADDGVVLRDAKVRAVLTQVPAQPAGR
jgi:hypothetical protein